MAYGNQAVVYGGTYLPRYVALTGITAVAATTFTATAVGTGAAIDYSIGGNAYTKATIAAGATPTTDAVTGAAFPALAANRAAVVVLALDAAGNIKACQGPIVTLDSGGLLQGACEFPMVPDSLCPIGYIFCKNGSTGSAWTFGTSTWAATGMVATPHNIMALPVRPVVS